LCHHQPCPSASGRRVAEHPAVIARQIATLSTARTGYRMRSSLHTLLPEAGRARGTPRQLVLSYTPTLLVRSDCMRLWPRVKLIPSSASTCHHPHRGSPIATGGRSYHRKGPHGKAKAGGRGSGPPGWRCVSGISLLGSLGRASLPASRLPNHGTARQEPRRPGSRMRPILRHYPRKAGPTPLRARRPRATRSH